MSVPPFVDLTSADEEECGHRWDGGKTGLCRCIKPSSHVTDITDDDHRCCCGISSWTTEPTR